MGFDPPGLEHTPDDESLAGFRSLMPKIDTEPGFLSRLVRLPFKIIGLPFRAARAVLRVPLRILGLAGRESNTGSQD